jgi:hypothetical protein
MDSPQLQPTLADLSNQKYKLDELAFILGIKDEKITEVSISPGSEVHQSNSESSLLLVTTASSNSVIFAKKVGSFLCAPRSYLVSNSPPGDRVPLPLEILAQHASDALLHSK